MGENTEIFTILSEFLKINKSLIIIDFYNNELGKNAVGFKSLLEGIAKNTNLIAVSFGKNKIQDLECVKCLAELIEKNETLEEI